MDLDEKLGMLKQMRWVEAHAANGGNGDPSTDRLIRIHLAIQAIEAAKELGEPPHVLSVDIDGYPLDPKHPWVVETVKNEKVGYEIRPPDRPKKP